MKGTQEELDELLSRYETESTTGALVIIMFEILKELKRLRISQ